MRLFSTRRLAGNIVRRAVIGWPITGHQNDTGGPPLLMRYFVPAITAAHALRGLGLVVNIEAFLSFPRDVPRVTMTRGFLRCGSLG